MPAPTNTLPVKASSRPIFRPLATYSATAEAEMATNSAARIVGQW